MTTMRDDPRNVIDYYAYWKEEAIKADLRERHNNFSVLVENHIRDFNLGSLIRNCNAFCGKEVIIYGSKKFDKRGAVGSYLYTSMRHVKHIEEFDFKDYTIVGVDNVEGATPLEEFQWPDGHVVMAFGQEQVGITQEILSMCKHVVYITQYGSVRSLNVGCASAIAMYDYCNKKVKRINNNIYQT